MKKAPGAAITIVALAATLVVAVACAGPQPAVARGEALYANCKMCHGSDGRGMPAIGAPAIAGMPAWYVEAQLTKFKEGQRGLHFDDEAGMRMRPMALALQTPADIRAAAAYVASMPRVKNERVLTTGNAESGRALFGTCTACHGANGEGKPELSAPPLTSLNDWYIEAQIKKFKLGWRGADPRDATGAQMRAMAGTLPTDAAIHDVIAHIATLAEKN